MQINATLAEVSESWIAVRLPEATQLARLPIPKDVPTREFVGAIGTEIVIEIRPIDRPSSLPVEGAVTSGDVAPLARKLAEVATHPDIRTLARLLDTLAVHVTAQLAQTSAAAAQAASLGERVRSLEIAIGGVVEQQTLIQAQSAAEQEEATAEAARRAEIAHAERVAADNEARERAERAAAREAAEAAAVEDAALNAAAAEEPAVEPATSDDPAEADTAPMTVPDEPTAGRRRRKH